MELSEWIRQFNEEQMFQRQAEQADTVLPISPRHELLPVTWPNGTSFDPLKPFYDDGTEKTYETLEEMVDEVGRIPRKLSFGIATFG